MEVISSENTVFGPGGYVRQFVSIKDVFEVSGEAAGEQALLSSYHSDHRIGGGTLVWAPEVLKTSHDGFRVFSPTVPTTSLSTSQSSILDYMTGSGEIDSQGSGCWLRLLEGTIELEYGGVTEGTDCGLLVQRIMDACVPSGTSVNCTISLTVGSPLTIPEYRTNPPASLDFNRSRVHIRHLICIQTSGVAVSIGSCTARLTIDWMQGAGFSGHPLVGIQISGMGGNIIDVGQIGGFQNNVEFNNSYSNVVNMGWCDNAIRGIVFINSNANKLNGGHIGGRYSDGTIPTDPTTCEVGVYVNPTSSNNMIYSTIEYCRRSEISVGLRDSGFATVYRGYIESCTGWNIYADGKDAEINVLAGGTTTRTDGAGFYAGPENTINFATQVDYYNELPRGDNTSLTFLSLQAIASAGTGKVNGKRGMETITRNYQSATNLLLDSSDFISDSWNKGGTSGASWSGIATPSDSAMPDSGYENSTQIIFPALPSEKAIYRASQGPITMINGPISFGCFVLCVSGDIEIMLRVVNSTGSVQHRHVTRLKPSANFQKIGSELTYTGASDSNSTFEITFRSSIGATIYVTNCYFQNRVGVKFPPANGNTLRNVLSGEDVGGNTFHNGATINGIFRTDYRVTSKAIRLDKKRMQYSMEVLTGDGYNVLLEPGRDGQEIIFKRDSSVGVVGVIPLGATIEGSLEPIPLSTAWQTLRLKYIQTPAFTGWIRV
ncbi:hypothetical protein HKK55_08030 [Pseudomonas sp. ADAK18]|uniref:hypothetical protein n=1 Tax=Pseudomonas sp. ADAK18 TaxID=2730848 RepID=UPI0014639261|nr:hypothetical protein [Pseudomonas sp. ADAK18]QJI28669.1 hypothetical protein HKK55_08030 [Pseudomonas sp. ADAK18]